LELARPEVKSRATPDRDRSSILGSGGGTDSEPSLSRSIPLEVWAGTLHSRDSGGVNAEQCHRQVPSKSRMSPRASRTWQDFEDQGHAFRRHQSPSFCLNECVKKNGDVMYLVFELLACVAMACVLGALLFVAAIVLMTAREAVKLAPSALHRITHQIRHLNASLGDSSMTTAFAKAQTHFGEAPSALVLDEARN
jgi:hypothetical protein